MVPRYLIAAGEVRVSREGVDVLMAAEADLLLSIQKRPTQMILSGSVLIAAGQTVTVPYGMTLAALPIVLFQSSNGNNQTMVLPFSRQASAGGGYQARILRRLADMDIHNRDSVARWVGFRVIRGSW